MEIFKERIADVYVDEGEWVVKDRDLKIPKAGTRVYIFLSSDTLVELEKMKSDEPFVDRLRRLRPKALERFEEKVKWIEDAKKILRGFDLKIIDEKEAKKGAIS